MLPPALYALQKRLKLLALQASAGGHASARIGTGLSMEDVREYTPGDDVRRIDWNVTARLQVPHVKRFREERERLILVLLDTSPRLDFTSQHQTKRQLAGQFALFLTELAKLGQDRLGMIVNGSPPQYTAPAVPRNIEATLAWHEGFLQAPATHKPLQTMLEMACQLPLRKASVFLVSDFLEVEEGPLAMLGRKHQFHLIRLTDPWEEELPRAGMIELRDAATGKRQWLDTSHEATRQAYQRRAAERQAAFATLASRVKAKHADLSTHADGLMRCWDALYRTGRG
jgi:uncharacterized protein (DUF58 family)